MKKEFVPYELAVRLKSLGFDEPCFAMWTQGWNESEWSSSMLPRLFSTRFRLNDTQRCESYSNNQDTAFGVAAPTFSQAFEWFGKNHKLFGELYYDSIGGFVNGIIPDDWEPSYRWEIKKPIGITYSSNYTVTDDEDKLRRLVIKRDQARLDCLETLLYIVEKFN